MATDTTVTPGQPIPVSSPPNPTPVASNSSLSLPTPTSTITPGLQTSEGKIVIGFIFIIGLLVAVFDCLVGVGALSSLPTWSVAAVDGSYLTASSYLGVNYAQQRTNLKIAVLGSSNASSS